MASDFDWASLLGPILSDHEILGTKGCIWPVNRTSILVAIDHKVLFEDRLNLICNQYLPEGFGFAAYPHDHLEIPSDVCGNKGILVNWNSMKSLPDGDDLYFLRNISDHFLVDGSYEFDDLSYFVPLRNRRETTMRILDLFSGGFGGWHRAAKFLQQSSNLSFQTVGIEMDINIATTFAISHSISLLRDIQGAPKQLLKQSTGDWVLVADVQDHSWHPIVAEYAPTLITISSPCKPWSGASSSPGLYRDDGRLLIEAILTCRWFRPKCILLEQVSAFASHRHKVWITRALIHIGYKLVWQKVFDLADQSATKRPRWLALAVRCHLTTTPQPQPSWFKSEANTPKAFDTIVQLTHDERKALEPSSSTLAIAKDPKFFRGHSVFGGFNQQQQILRKRIYTPDVQLPTFMALYGSQHQLDLSYLEQYGFFGHFLEDSECTEGCRYWHPIEVALIHGITSPILIQHVWPLSWLIIGNAISEQQAIVVVADACQRITGERFSAFTMFTEYQQKRYTASNIRRVMLGEDVLIKPIEQDESLEFVKHAKTLRHAVDQQVKFAFWTPDKGCQINFDETDSTKSCHPFSQITQPDHGIVETTAAFPTTVMIQMEHQGGSNGIEISPSFPWEMLNVIWAGGLDFVPNDLDSLKIHFAKVESFQQSFECIPKDEVTILLHHNQIYCFNVPFEKDNGMLQSITNQPLFNLFGNEIAEQNRYMAFVTTDIYEFRRPTVDFLFVFAASQSTIVEFGWNPAADAILIQIKGEEIAKQVMLEFWGEVLTQATLKQIGRSIDAKEPGILVLAPVNTSVLPPLLTLELLSIQAAKILLSELCTSDKNSVDVKIKREGMVLWRGTLPTHTKLSQLAGLLQMAFVPTAGNLAIRFVKGGQNQLLDLTLLSIMSFDYAKHQSYVVLHAVSEIRGGGPSKQQTRTAVKNALASYLLEQGHDLQWVSSTVEAIMNKSGLTKVQHMVELSGGSAKSKAFDDMCKECGVNKPVITKPTAQTKFDNAPWNKGKKAKKSIQLIPQDYKIHDKYFINEDGTPCQQIFQLRAQACGICILSQEQAIPWLRGNQAISTDELAIFVRGQSALDTSLQVQSITIPCTNPDGESVLLSGQLVQFGAKEVKVDKSTTTSVVNEDCQMCALTLYKDDWTPDQWNDATHATTRFIRQILAEDQHDKDIVAMWGRSMKAGRAIASPAQCQSIQMHSTVLKAQLDKLLALSGHNRLYITTKDFNGRLDSSFKVLWLNGNHVELQATSAKLPECLGIVRGQKNMGLRFRPEAFKKAWALMYPGTTPPEKAMGDFMYKAEGLPYGCTQESLIKWGSVIGWKFFPLKALGPQSWLLRADNHPNKTIEMYNASPVLLRLLPPKSVGESPILLGPRPKQAPVVSTASLWHDPWAAWTGPRPTSTVADARKLDGPIEAKFAAQEEKIVAIQSELQNLANQQATHTKTVDEKFAKAEQREQRNMKQLESTIKDIQRDLQNTVSTAMASNTQAMDTRMQELKALFMKRKAPSEQDEEM